MRSKNSAERTGSRGIRLEYGIVDEIADLPFSDEGEEGSGMSRIEEIGAVRFDTTAPKLFKRDFLPAF